MAFSRCHPASSPPSIWVRTTFSSARCSSVMDCSTARLSEGLISTGKVSTVRAGRSVTSDSFTREAHLLKTARKSATLRAPTMTGPECLLDSDAKMVEEQGLLDKALDKIGEKPGQM